MAFSPIIINTFIVSKFVPNCTAIYFAVSKNSNIFKRYIFVQCFDLFYVYLCICMSKCACMCVHTEVKGGSPMH